jgi:hypothetical protein
MPKPNFSSAYMKRSAGVSRSPVRKIKKIRLQGFENFREIVFAAKSNRCLYVRMDADASITPSLAQICLIMTYSKSRNKIPKIFARSKIIPKNMRRFVSRSTLFAAPPGENLKRDVKSDNGFVIYGTDWPIQVIFV